MFLKCQLKIKDRERPSPVNSTRVISQTQCPITRHPLVQLRSKCPAMALIRNHTAIRRRPATAAIRANPRRHIRPPRRSIPPHKRLPQLPPAPRRLHNNPPAVITAVAEVMVAEGNLFICSYGELGLYSRRACTPFGSQFVRSLEFGIPLTPEHALAFLGGGYNTPSVQANPGTPRATAA